MTTNLCLAFCSLTAQVEKEELLLQVDVINLGDKITIINVALMELIRQN